MTFPSTQLKKDELCYQEIFKCPFCKKELISKRDKWWRLLINPFGPASAGQKCKHLLYIQNGPTVFYKAKKIEEFLGEWVLNDGNNLQLIDPLNKTRFSSEFDRHWEQTTIDRLCPSELIALEVSIGDIIEYSGLEEHAFLSDGNDSLHFELSKNKPTFIGIDCLA